MKPELPALICGPILRRTLPDRLVFWWISPEILTGRFEASRGGDIPVFSCDVTAANTRNIRIGTHAWVHLLDMVVAPELPVGEKITYDMTFRFRGRETCLARCLPYLTHPGERRPSFMVKTDIDTLLHGSCRNPHHSSEDAMAGADREIREALNDPGRRPALLMLTGDQIYADDVAGPMLHAIHQTIRRLGLYDERFTGAMVPDSQALYTGDDTYYRREEILPRTKVGNRWYNRGGRHPVFTSMFAHNHLISFAEFMAMYILVWSRAMWAYVRFDPGVVPEKYRDKYRAETLEIEKFIAALPAAQRVLSHVPCYMIFDDHDITDDWNLTAQWEKAAYGNPFARQIIGNGLIAYWLCQGWGNAPDKFDDIYTGAGSDFAAAPGPANHDRLMEALFKFENWEYELPTTPKTVVIDSRTRRWRSEKQLSNPSGLLDWEALSELQQKLIGEDKVILVAPAPIFGVKLIEAVQHLATFLGYPLVVDAENWMAHGGTAYTLLQIFKHIRTPSHFVILSGDVHYSFAVDVKIRFRDNSPRIWQITSSGIKNEFPGNLLKWLDRLNRWLYAPYSPLNIFTKRRDMKVRNRIPKGRGLDRLVNTSGIGLVRLDKTGRPVRIAELYANAPDLEFVPKYEEA